jgi:hypothetical protein
MTDETWTRITVHLDGTMHEVQLVSHELSKWIELLEDELDLQRYRGTDAGASLALEFAQDCGSAGTSGGCGFLRISLGSLRHRAMDVLLSSLPRRGSSAPRTTGGDDPAGRRRASPRYKF